MARSFTLLRKPQNFFLAAAPLFLVLFIDSMGVGLVFPILNALVVDPQAQFVASDLSESSRNLLYGFTISIYMFCWFFGAAFLGDVSDQIGRKKSLMICLLGAFVGYLCSAFAVIFSSYSLLLMGRMIAGFTAGSQAIAQAAIVDLSTQEHKARNLGLVLFSTSLGYIFGPMVGGMLSDASLLPWFNYAVPFYFAALISLLNVILLGLLFQESFTVQRKLRFKWNYAFEIFVSAFKNEKIRDLSVVYLVMVFGWSGIYSFISMYLLRVYQFSALKIGLYMGLMGVGFGIGTGFLIDPLLKCFSLGQCVMGCCVVVALSTALTIAAPSEVYLWPSVLCIGVAMATAYSTMLTLFSNQVDESSQGWIMGITGAIMAFAFGVNGFLVGILANFSPKTPLIIAIVSLLLTVFLIKKTLGPVDISTLSS